MTERFFTETAPAAPWSEGPPVLGGPPVFGAGAGRRFFHPVPAAGERPLRFSAEGLPSGLGIDPVSGVISGVARASGRFDTEIKAVNRHGSSAKRLEIVIGKGVALTPPMGWSSWNCWAADVDDGKIRAAADNMVFSGLAARGYSYINIDAGWQGLRGGEFNAIQGNKGFPDMGALCAYVHEKGLRIGIYSTPWVKSYCLKGEGFTGGSSGEMADGVQSPYVSHMKEKKYIGKITYESEDSAQWADWGFDYLKYDWIINDVPSASRMRAALDKVNRDIILSLSNNAPFQNAADWAALANCWRITGDITDTWESLCRNGFGQDKWAPFAGPGHWNDPDMLVLGRIGWGEPRACRLSRDEQITHMTLWSLLSAPLIAGCALSAIDDFTLALLCNDEVIAVNQDSLGFQARQIRDFSSADSGGNPLRHETVYVKKLADKSLAAGLFNRGPEGALIRLDWTELGLPGSRAVRDLWGRKDLGVFERGVELGVPSHGAQMLLIK